MAPPKGHLPYKGCETGGRPLTYTKEVVDKLAVKLEEWLKDKDNIFIQKFAYEIGFNHRKISEFKEISDKFREACDKLDAKQQFMLFEGGLKKKYAYPMCALILSHNHNISSKTEQKVTGSANDPLGFICLNIDGQSKD